MPDNHRSFAMVKNMNRGGAEPQTFAGVIVGSRSLVFLIRFSIAQL
jgi:hypothetical protein